MSGLSVGRFRSKKGEIKELSKRENRGSRTITGDRTQMDVRTLPKGEIHLLQNSLTAQHVSQDTGSKSAAQKGHESCSLGHHRTAV